MIRRVFLVFCSDNGRTIELFWVSWCIVSLDLYNIKNGTCEKLLFRSTDILFDIPTMQLSDLSLYVATREQTVASWKHTAAEWATGLTLEEYIHRERIGEKKEFARDGKLLTWQVRLVFFLPFEYC